VRLDQPALAPAGGPPSPAPMWDASDRQAMVRFLDGTWRLCRVTGWQQLAPGSWACELRWGVSGRIYQAGYVYDPAAVCRSGASGRGASRGGRGARPSTRVTG
jgi:hypothetical protein